MPRNLSLTHTGLGTYHQPILVLDSMMNPYRSENLSWIHTGPGFDYEPIPVPEPIMNPYRSRNLSWTHTGPGTYHELIPDLTLILNPYRIWNWYWSYTGPGTESKPIKDLELILNPYRSWNRSWTTDPHRSRDPEIAPFIFLEIGYIYFLEQYQELFRIRNGIRTWCGYVSDTIPVSSHRHYHRCVSLLAPFLLCAIVQRVLCSCFRQVR